MDDLTIKEINKFITKIGGTKVVVKFLKDGDLMFETERIQVLNDELSKVNSILSQLQQECHKESKRLDQWIETEDKKNFLKRIFSTRYARNYLRILSDSLYHL